MGIRYRKRVKVAPGVYFNLSKSGVSTTLKAGKGVSINMGKNGSYLNTGIPGTGLYSRQKISGETMEKKKSNANLSQETNAGCWYTFWVFLTFVMLGIFIIGLLISGNIMAGVGGVGTIACVVCALISRSIGSEKSNNTTKALQTVECNNSNALTSEMIEKETEEDDSESEHTGIDVEKKKAITEEMVQKLLAPFPDEIEDIPPDRDPMYIQAKRLVIRQQKATIVMLQRELQISNLRAGCIIDQLEKDNIIGAARGSQPRKVLVANMDWFYSNPTMEQVLEATKLVVISQAVSTSLIMRKLQMGFSKSVKIIDRLVEAGIVGSFQSNKTRSVLVNSLEGFDELVNKKISVVSDESLFVADELFSLCLQLEKDFRFTEEFSRHNIKVTDNNGRPLCGDGGEVRSLFFLDVAHCYSEMAETVDIKRDDGVGILYLMFRLIEPTISVPHDGQHIDVIKNTMSSGAESLINQLIDKPFFNDEGMDFTVAAILKRYNKDLLNKYLTLLFRFCSLIAKADGKITDKEQQFLDHIAQLRSNSKNRHEGMVVQETSDKKEGVTELNRLIGLDTVKQEVRSMSNYIKVQLSRQRQGLKTTQVSYHCVFTGNPGTGKTTVARILASIYKELGVLKKGHLVETDRSGLVAEFVGQTAVKTNKVIDSALDGVLFVDEAYSLVVGSGNDFGNEAISTLLKRMEDDRDRLIVILAGYGNEMKQFIDSNPGLQSRFNRYIHFPDYNSDELLQIFFCYAQKNDYEVTPEAHEKLKLLLENVVNTKDINFGNARFVRNLFEKTLEKQANRISIVERPTLSQLKEIRPEDIS